MLALVCPPLQSHFSTVLLRGLAGLEEFGISLSNGFRVLQELLGEGNVVTGWQGIRGAVALACQDVVNPMGDSRRGWMMAET